MKKMSQRPRSRGANRNLQLSVLTVSEATVFFCNWQKHPLFSSLRTTAELPAHLDMRDCGTYAAGRSTTIVAVGRAGHRNIRRERRLNPAAWIGSNSSSLSAVAGQPKKWQRAFCGCFPMSRHLLPERLSKLLAVGSGRHGEQRDRRHGNNQPRNVDSEGPERPISVKEVPATAIWRMHPRRFSSWRAVSVSTAKLMLFGSLSCRFK